MEISSTTITPERVQNAIYVIRGERVMVDRDLATLYGVSSKAFNQSVKRHKDRFPEDFMFQLTVQEARNWWLERMATHLRSQSVTLKRGQHLKYRPYVFTEHGILMLVLPYYSPDSVLIVAATFLFTILHLLFIPC